MYEDSYLDASYEDRTDLGYDEFDRDELDPRGYDGDEDYGDDEDDEPEQDKDDGQPSEYDEWQDLYGGDDWDHGQHDGDSYYGEY